MRNENFLRDNSMNIQIQIGFNQVCSFKVYVKSLSCRGGHLVFQINTKTDISNTYVVSEKSRFDISASQKESMTLAAILSFQMEGQQFIFKMSRT